MKRTKKKGFTLIELIIVLAITVVILGVIFTFGVVNNKMLGTAEVKSTLQNEGEAIQKELLSIGTQGKDITLMSGDFGVDQSPALIAYDRVDTTNNENKLEVTKISFRIYADSTLTTMQTYTFNLETQSNGEKWLYLKNDADATGKGKLLSKNVTHISITPLDYQTVPSKSAANFSNATGLRVTFDMHIKKGFSDVDYPVSTIVNFRNRTATT